MIEYFTSFKTAIRNGMVVFLIAAALLGSQGVSRAESHTPWTFDYSGGGGIKLSYEGVPVIGKSTLQVTTPDWKKTFYVPMGAKQNIQKNADGSWHISAENSFFSSQYDLRPLDAQTFQIHYKGELLQDVSAHLEFNVGYFSGNLFYNRPFTARIRAMGATPEHTISGIVPASPAHDSLADNDLAPNFQSLTIDSRIGKMTLKVLSEKPIVFGDARRHGNIKAPIFWCGWLADNDMLLQKGKPMEMTLTIHIDSSASLAPNNAAIAPALTPVADAYVPAKNPVQVIPEPKQMSLDANHHFDLQGAVKWSITAPEQDERLTNAVQQLLGSEWNLQLSPQHSYKSTFAGWYGIHIGKDAPIHFPSNIAGEQWASHSDAYRLTADQDGIQIISPTAHGVFYGIQTLAQLLRADHDSVNVPFAHIEDWPTLQFRGALFEPSQPDVSEMKQLIGMMARSKYNYAVIDCTLVKWKSHPEIAWDGAIDESDLRELVNLCRANFIEPIPLIEGPGHANWLIRNKQNLDIAEDPEYPVDLSVNNPKSLPLVHSFMETLIDIFHPKYFHIGGDEANRGRFPNPDNSFNSKGETASNLMVKYVKEQRNWLAERNIKTMVWGDMFLYKQNGIYAANADSAGEAQKSRAALPKDVIIMDWQYNVSDTYPSLEQFQKEGLTTVATPWYEPENVRNFTQVAINANAWGTLQSTWFRALAGTTPVSAIARHPEDFSAYFLGADYSWSGRKEMPDALPYDPARLLTNALVTPLRDQHSGDLVDLSQAANVSADSWLGLGNNQNIASFFASQNGSFIRRLGNVDFRIPDRKFVVLSARAGIMAPEGALQKLTLTLNKKASEIAFLHSALWEPAGRNKNIPDISIAAKGMVTYADGTQSEITFRLETNIASWLGNRETAYATRAWSSKLPDGQTMNLQVYRWHNPHPEKPIASLQLQAVNARVGYALAGLTLLSVK